MASSKDLTGLSLLLRKSVRVVVANGWYSFETADDEASEKAMDGAQVSDKLSLSLFPGLLCFFFTIISLSFAIKVLIIYLIKFSKCILFHFDPLSRREKYLIWQEHKCL